MTSTHIVPKKITAVFAVIFLLPALYIFILWLNAFKGDGSDAQKINIFTDNFSGIFKDYKTILLISITCCVISMVLAAKSFKQRLVSLRIAMLLTVIIAALIFFLHFFQLL
jgi:hypothetical protein